MLKSVYKDRGMMKWAPFDALVGHSGLIAAIKHNMEKKEMPILSEDQLDDLNKTIIKALNEKKEILVTYYQDGYFHQSFGFIKKIDPIQKRMIFLSMETINISTITKILIYEE
ncbi:YolD-like family protein [Acholeplasma sp. OttesenSCG-928-E16]|nr:YolD-like family protein [Acholeplasma sp. OttesenSCG-928-E16]